MARRRYPAPKPQRRGKWWTLRYWQDQFISQRSVHEVARRLRKICGDGSGAMEALIDRMLAQDEGTGVAQLLRLAEEIKLPEASIGPQEPCPCGGATGIHRTADGSGWQFCRCVRGRAMAQADWSGNPLCQEPRMASAIEHLALQKGPF